MLQFPPLTPVVRALLVVLTLSFVGQTVAEGLFGVDVTRHLAVLPALPSFELAWQWATYVLVESPGQGAPLARAFSLFFIYLMLGQHEMRFGARGTLTVAAAGVVGGSLAVLLVGLPLPGLVSGAIGCFPIAWAAFGAFTVYTRGQPVRFFLMPEMSSNALLGIFLFIPLLESIWAHDGAPFLLALGPTLGGMAWARITLRPARKPAPTTGKKRAGQGRFRVIEGGGEGGDDEKPRWLN